MSSFKPAVLAGICLAAAGPAGIAAAADFPNRSLRMVVPFAPGGASDVVARVIQPAYVARLGQQMVIDNRSGAAGNIGVEVTVRANADGYTLLLGNSGTMAINPVYFTKFPYRPLKDLAPITQLVDVAGAVVVHPSIPAKSIKELVAHLKANPGKLNYGAAAPSGPNTLDTLMFMSMTGTTATQIAYKGGAGPAAIGLMANEVQFSFSQVASTIGFTKAGRMRMVAVIAPERSKALPDVPTLRESGYDMVVGAWQGLFAPAGTPAPVINALYKASLDAMCNSNVVNRLDELGVTIVTSRNIAEFAAFVKSETARYGKVISDWKIQTE